MAGCPRGSGARRAPFPTRCPSRGRSSTRARRPGRRAPRACWPSLAARPRGHCRTRGPRRAAGSASQ
eukprot:646126-Alexandrium_andersonii.AAC.1